MPQVKTDGRHFLDSLMKFAALSAVGFFCPFGPATASAADNLIKNGTLKEWRDGVPIHWNVNVGARSGSDLESELTPIAGGGISLKGHAKTGIWRSARQGFPVRPGAYYRIRFEARTTDLRRESGQFNNC